MLWLSTFSGHSLPCMYISRSLHLQSETLYGRHYKQSFDSPPALLRIRHSASSLSLSLLRKLFASLLRIRHSATISLARLRKHSYYAYNLLILCATPRNVTNNQTFTRSLRLRVSFWYTSYFAQRLTLRIET